MTAAAAAAYMTPAEIAMVQENGGCLDFAVRLRRAAAQQRAAAADFLLALASLVRP